MKRRWWLVPVAVVCLLVAAWVSMSGDEHGASVRGRVPEASGVEVGEAPGKLGFVRSGSTTTPSRSLSEIVSLGASPGSEAELDKVREVLRFEGRVVDLEDVPIAGASVFYADRLVATSDASGWVAGSSLLLGDGYFGGLIVCADGFAQFDVRFDFSRGETWQLGLVRLSPGAAFSGRVLDSQGRGIGGAWVACVVAQATSAQVLAAIRGAPNGVDPDEWFDLFDLEGNLDVTSMVAMADGSFCLRGVPEGDVFLLGYALGKRPSAIGPFVVTPGSPVEREIQLEDDRLIRVLRGVVRLPSGAPLAGAHIAFDVRGQSRADRVIAGPGGRFETEFNEDCWRMTAHDVKRRWYSGELTEWSADADEVEILMRAPEWVDVVIADEAGAPLAWSNVRCTDGTPGYLLEPGGERGVATIRKPEGEFRLEAFAPGYTSVTFGSMVPADIDATGTIVLRLAMGGAVQGMVLFGGQPVAGARIGLGAVGDWVQPSARMTLSDRPFWFRANLGFESHDATTDANGRFEASLLRDGSHVIVVSAEGLPLTTFGPFEWEHSARVRGLALEISAGGSIEGRVLVAPGASAVGRIVGACIGWNYVRSTTVRDDGTYRIAGLAPGDYQVRVMVPPVASLQRIDGQGMGRPREVAWDCSVRSGATTSHDVDLSGEGSVIVEGEFRWDGVSAEETIGYFQLRDLSGDVVTESSMTAGRFTEALSNPGEVIVGVHISAAEFTQPFTLLRGTNVWSAVVPFGSLRCTFVGGAVEFDDPRMTCEWEGSSGLRFSAKRWVEEGDREILLGRVPTGPVRVRVGGGEWQSVDVREGVESMLDFHR